MLAQCRGGGSFGNFAAVCRVEAAVRTIEEFARRREVLLGEERGHQAGQRAAKLMELDRRRTPRGERAGRLTARKPECGGHRLRIESTQGAYGGRGAERSDRAGAVPAPTPERRVIHTGRDSCRRLEPGGQCDEQIAPARMVALRDAERRRDDDRLKMRRGRTIDIAHRYRGDEKAVE